MASVLVYLNDREKEVLKRYADDHRMSMSACILLALDNMLPNFKDSTKASTAPTQPRSPSTSVGTHEVLDPQFSVEDLDFDE